MNSINHGGSRCGRAPAAALGLAVVLLVGALDPAPAAGQAAAVPEYREAADRLIEGAKAERDASWERLAYLVDTFGPRLSGSVVLENAIDWALEEMERDGFDEVRGDTVMVPRWVRGEESLELLLPRKRSLPMLGLGRSVATPPGGIRAEVLVVGSFEELEERADEARGRIVLFDVPFTTYGPTVQYRTQGAIHAARAGAVASLIRSVGPFGMQTPHTGGMSYEEGVPRIPHAAITMEDAMMLRRFQERGQRIEVLLSMEAQTFPDAPSRNVIAELRGTERPEEVVVVGGHIDSWDVGQGAMDDAGGSVAAWEAVRLMKELGMRPRRTVRVVLWTAEEVGLVGAHAYRDRYLDELDRHVLALESDAGVFEPRGFAFTGSDDARAVIEEVAGLLEGIGADGVREGAAPDVIPLIEEGVPGMGLWVDGERYFWYHHTDADTLDKLDPDELARCIAAMAVMVYVVADLPEPLPR